MSAIFKVAGLHGERVGEMLRGKMLIKLNRLGTSGMLGALIGISALDRTAMAQSSPTLSLQQSLVKTREPDYPKVMPPDPKRIPPNPLDEETPDPLFPDRTRRLGELGREELRLTLDALSTEANQLLVQKKADDAFKLWFRELRLRRILGDREEIFALARIGEIAWQNNRTRDLRDITERLQKIQINIADLHHALFLALAGDGAFCFGSNPRLKFSTLCALISRTPIASENNRNDRLTKHLKKQGKG